MAKLLLIGDGMKGTEEPQTGPQRASESDERRAAPKDTCLLLKESVTL